MCSWCWGFAPVLERLVAEHDLDLRIVVGGLRPGTAAEPLTDRMKGSLLHHWDQVQVASGQPFDREALADRDSSWRYDTELPAIAVTLMRQVDSADELRLFTTLQEAFYAKGIDITDPGVYPSLLADFDVDVSWFVAQLTAHDAKRGAWDDFAEARRLGASGFPTTLLAVGDRYRMLAAGYRPYAEVDQILHAALERFAPAAAAGAACSVDGVC